MASSEKKDESKSGTPDRRLLSSLKRSLAGSKSHVAELFEQLETLMMSFENRPHVEKLQHDIELAFTDMLECHELYVNVLPDGEERTKAVVEIEIQIEGKQEVFTHVCDWLSRCRDAEAARESKKPPSKASSIRSNQNVSSIKIAELERAVAELALEQAKRRQAEEETFKKKSEIRAKEDALEIAKLKESILASDDVFPPATKKSDPAKSVMFRNPLEGYERVSDYNYLLVPGSSLNPPTGKLFADASASRTTPPLNPLAKQFSMESRQSADSALVNALLQNDLPRPEMEKFDGDPRKYSKFLHAFKKRVEPRLSDNGLRLSYLLQFCTGPALEAIDDCVLMPDAIGYKKALEILYQEYGRPHIICQTYIQSLRNGEKIKSNDGKLLSALARDMRKCIVTLSSLGYDSDMHNSETILKIVKRLPYHLQSKWSYKASEIIDKNCEPNFDDLHSFVEAHAKVYSTYYAQHLNSGSSSNSMPKSKPITRLNNRNSGYHSFVSVDQCKDSCIMCNESHDISNCDQFKEKSVRDRANFLRENNACFNCLKPGHLSIGCLVPSCGVQGCKGKHHDLLHRKQYFPKRKLSPVPAIAVQDNTPSTSLSLHSSRKVSMKVLPVKVKSGTREELVYALLDSGSDVSLITDKLVNKLGLDSRAQRSFKINTIGAARNVQGKRVSFTLSPLDDSDSIRLNNALTIDKLPLDERNIPHVENLRRWKHLDDVDIQSIDSNTVDILIGLDVPAAFWVIDQRMGRKKDPYAVKSILGWTVVGPLGDSTHKSDYFVNNLVAGQDVLDQQIQRLWDTDFADLNIIERAEMSQNDKVALSKVSSSLKYNGERYECSLPWKLDKEELCGNFYQAKHRLDSLKRRLVSDSNLYKGYCDTMKSYIGNGHAGKVNEKDISKLWFLPHHPVCNPQKKKIRVVFDCAAMHSGKSLNQHLYSGPDYTSSLVGVLMRFRNNKIAISGDIENMFHQVLVNPEDRDKLCFLWWPDGNIHGAPEVYQMNVHLFGATSSPFCANYSLRSCGRNYEGRCDDSIRDSIEDSFYVDDFLASVETAEQAIKLRSGVSEVLKSGGFRICKWSSNSRSVIKSIPKEDLSPSLSMLNLNMEPLPVDKTLGLFWNSESDSFRYNPSIIEKPSTRRGILSVLSSIYDPLGFLSPYCLSGKLVLQRLVKRKVDWDYELTASDLETKAWNKWMHQLPSLSSFRIPRCIKPDGEIIKTQLHYFSDASKVGYGAVAYIRHVTANESISCNFLFGKSRLAPVKHVTVPRLELTAAVLATEIHGIVSTQHKLNPNQVFLWTDSKIFEYYIKNKHRRFKTFVSNRLNKILSITSPDQWRHVHGNLNPSDDASRGLPASELTPESRWLRGPDFLWLKESSWPNMVQVDEVSDDELELDVRVKVFSTTTPLKPLDRIIDYYSTWRRLIKSTCWWIRFKAYLRNKRTFGVEYANITGFG